MKKIKMTKCRFCGGTEFITGYQNFYGAVYSAESMLRSSSLYHTICRECGSVVRTYVKDPEKLLKKKDRKSSQGEE
ncbi:MULTISPECIES: hypothetical protein [Ruminococcus]|uniref:Uncharacterized protein n=1 Tax=Ruminococcus flavefaciens TaxID=1265 RepID=A0A1M7HC72_RUMFL|nr:MULTISPECIES: hypothetical protein [Ruminococcus]MCR4795369.1 hypothetical protein [Ruminococcus sp.]SHM26074.1 hypothetical protein SAMN04487860_102258 [Ruminococcus flavefaciens]